MENGSPRAHDLDAGSLVVDDSMPDAVFDSSSLVMNDPFVKPQPMETGGASAAELSHIAEPDVPPATLYGVQEMAIDAEVVPAGVSLSKMEVEDFGSSQASGICYDARMRFHAVINPVDDHPEDPRRIYRIYRAIESAGLTSICSLTAEGRRALRRIPVREALKEEVLLVHDLNHWESMLATANMTYEQLIKLGTISDSMYFNSESAYCARLASGGAIETCKAVVQRRVKNAIAVIRPPGHHAEPDQASGFCLFNNVSVAVRVTMQNEPEIQRVLILDWDVHHGNGTQTAFYKDPNVLFISLHRYENATFYPGTDYGGLDKCGEEDGVGRNINIPWSTKGMGDADYIHAFEKVVMPIAREFNPDLVVISAGFDAAAGDPIGECFVTPTGYAHMTHQLMELADGKCVAVLEGGYNLTSISESALSVTRTLMGEAPPRLDGQDPSPQAIETVHKVCLEQSKFWRSMAPLAFNHKPRHKKAARLHDVVRSFQAQNLRRQYNMVPLPLLEDRASASFENQALSTPDFHSSETLLFFIHDAPDVWSNPHPNHNRIQLHDSFLPDSATMFIDWAAQNKFGIIDINVPSVLSDTSTSSSSASDSSSNQSYNVVDETTRLVKYLWDNYIELTDAKNIIFLSIGESCPGIVNMISMKDVTRRVCAVINIYGRHPLKALTSVEDSLITWYYNTSLCFTTSDNDVWNSPKRPKRKFGKVIKGETTEMDDLVFQSHAAATEFIMEQIRNQDA